MEIAPQASTPSNGADGITGAFMSEEEEVEDVCRICRLPGDFDNPLRYPCACRGSIKFVHQDCLLNWFKHSRFPGKCEVCKHVFSFTPVYAENAPTTLPLQEFVAGMAMKARRFLQFVLRLSFVMSIWLLMIPFMTLRVWRLSFVRSFGEAKRLFLTGFSPRAILIDCLLGFLLEATIGFIFGVAISLMGLGGRAAEREINAPRAQHNMNLAVDGIDRAGQPEAHVDGLDGAEAEEAMTFYEFVGMQGPVLDLLEMAFAVLASLATFLGVVIFLPFSLGRLVIFYFTPARGPLLSAVVPYTETSYSLPNITMTSVLTDVTDLVSFGQGSGALNQVSEMLKVNTCGLNAVSNQVSSPLYLMENSIAGATRLSDFTILAIGYMIIISSLAFLYVAIVALILCKKGERLTVGRFRGIVSIAETTASCARQLLAALKPLMYVIKVVLLWVIGFGIFPILCGWWLDVCIIAMFSEAMQPMVKFCLFSSFYRTMMQFFLGVIYMCQIRVFFSVFQKTLRDEVLCYLPDSKDINYNPLHDLDAHVCMHAYRILVSVALHESLIVLIVFVPVKLVLRVFPTVFPLDLTASDPLAILPANMMILQIFIPFASKHFMLRATLQFLLRYWFTTVGWALGLTDFLRPRPEDDGPQENINRDLEGKIDSDDNFVLRIVFLLLIAWMTMIVFTSSVIVVPVSIGRAILNVVHILPRDIRLNDQYTFAVGSFTICNALLGATYSIQQIKARKTAILASQTWKWLNIILRSCVVLSIWAFVIPMLIGYLFNFMAVPVLVPADVTPNLNRFSKWSCGVMFLQLWTLYVMEDPLMPLVDERWRAKFERVKQDGFTGLRVFWVLREIVCPVLIRLLLALCVPYVFARMFPLLGFSLQVNAAVDRFAWIGCLSFTLLCLCIKECYIWLKNLYHSMHEDRYQIHRELQNFGEPA